LPLRQTDIGRRDTWPIGDWLLFIVLPSRWFIASKDFRRNVDAASEDQLERA